MSSTEPGGSGLCRAGRPACSHCPLHKGKGGKGEGEGGTRKHSGAQDFFLIYRIFSNSVHIWRDLHTVMKDSLYLDIGLNFPWCSVVGHTIAIRLMHPWDSSLAYNKYQKNTTLCHTNHHKKEDQNKKKFLSVPAKLYFLPFGYHFNGAKAGYNDFTQDIRNSNHSAFLFNQRETRNEFYHFYFEPTI